MQGRATFSIWSRPLNSDSLLLLLAHTLLSKGIIIEMTQPQQQAPTIVSAPGKVLLTGGYLVLDQKYQGLVVGTTARFFTSIRNDQGLSPGTIRVEAPQFTADNVWEYSIRTDEEDQLVVEK